MPDASTVKRDYQKLNPREFLDISIWNFKFVYNISPKFTSIFTATKLLTGLFEVATSLIVAKLVDRLVDSIKNNYFDLQGAKTFIIVIFGFSIFKVLIDYFSGISRINIDIAIYGQTKKTFLEKINSLSVQTLEQPSVNDNIHRANTYLNTIIHYFYGILNSLTVFVRLISLVTVTIKFQPLYVLFVAIIGIPLYILDKKQRANVYKFMYDNTEIQRKHVEIGNKLSDVAFLKEIKLTQAFQFLLNKYWNFQKWFIDTRIKIILTWRKQTVLFNILLQSVSIYFIYKIILEAFKGLISTGDMLFRYRSVDQLKGSLTNMLNDINDLGEQAIYVKEVHTFFQIKSDFPEGNNHIKKLTAGPAIKLDNLNFKYPSTDKIVLEDINIEINAGEKVAIVGANGAGKTTIVKLICKIYYPTKGHIAINNTDLTDLNSTDWHRNIGILFQDFNSYPQLTAKENIYIGDSLDEIDEKRILAAADHAEATKFINEFPQKLDQILDEKIKGGIRPSTGQWQKLAIARFFYRDAPLVIFDEPTASIDAVSEFNIFNSIYKFFKNKTVIIISHRFSTVRNADRILVLDQGKIIEQGNHAELMALNGKYAESFLLQAKGYVDSIL